MHDHDMIPLLYTLLFIYIQDIATVDILERAQRVDPTGERTLGVITKVDLINPGSEEEVMSVVNNIRKRISKINSLSTMRILESNGKKITLTWRYMIRL